MAAKVKDFNARGLARTPGGMATAYWVLPEVFDSLCRAEAAKVPDFGAREFAHTRWARAKTGRGRPEVFDSLCRAVAARVKDFDAHDPADPLRHIAATN